MALENKLQQQRLQGELAEARNLAQFALMPAQHAAELEGLSDTRSRQEVERVQ